jgi:uncharacterized protein (DUF3084 family)
MSDVTVEGALDSVSSQVTEAFGRLTHVQDELRVRLQAVAERERSVEETKKSLDELAADLDARTRDLHDAEEQNRSRVAELERRTSEMEEAHRQRQAQCDARETSLRDREAHCEAREAECTARETGIGAREEQVARREDVVAAFQEMLAQMHAALETLAPDSIMSALDAGTAYEDSAKGNRMAGSDVTPSSEDIPAKDPIGLTPEEQTRFFTLRDAGKSDAEILAEIYEARTARNGTPA